LRQAEEKNHEEFDVEERSDDVQSRRHYRQDLRFVKWFERWREEGERGPRYC
jgi:hypothetical protein